MLEVFDLQVSYGAIKALDGVSFAVPQGRIVTLLGANGSGKTTTIRAITGLAAPQAGRILFEGRPLQGLPPHEVVRRGVAVVPEGRRIFINLSVHENLLLGGYVRRDQDSLARDLDEIYDTFPRLAERRGQPAGTLSGGEQQMLALGRALMSRPRLLLLDEPSLGLAPLLVREVFKILSRLNRRQSFRRFRANAPGRPRPGLPARRPRRRCRRAAGRGKRRGPRRSRPCGR